MSHVDRRSFFGKLAVCAATPLVPTVAEADSIPLDQYIAEKQKLVDDLQRIRDLTQAEIDERHRRFREAGQIAYDCLAALDFTEEEIQQAVCAVMNRDHAEKKIALNLLAEKYYGIIFGDVEKQFRSTLHDLALNRIWDAIVVCLLTGHDGFKTLGVVKFWIEDQPKLVPTGLVDLSQIKVVRLENGSDSVGPFSVYPT